MTELNKKSFYSFGEAEAVGNSRVFDYLGSFMNAAGEYYIPPVSFAGLSAMRNANAQHSSCCTFRALMLYTRFDHGPLPLAELRKAVMDFIIFGNAFFEIVRDGFGRIARLQYLPTINMRILTRNRGFRQLLEFGQYIDFMPDEIFHIACHDTIQQIYGIPDYLGGMQSVLLNQDATVFRRKYFKNGCHLGYILYTNDPLMTPDQENQMKDKIESGKGAGNFKTMFVSIPNGSPDAIKIISVGDISQKDEFQKIKEISAADVREAHRVPPVLMGVVPTGTGNLGDPEKIERVYVSTEVAGLAANFTGINEFLPANLHFKFNLETQNNGQ